MADILNFFPNLRIAWNGAFLYFNASGHALQTSEETLYTSTIMATLVTLSTHTILQAGHLVAFGQLFSEAFCADQSVVQTQHPAPFSLAQVLNYVGTLPCKTVIWENKCVWVGLRCKYLRHCKYLQREFCISIEWFWSPTISNLNEYVLQAIENSLFTSCIAISSKVIVKVPFLK